MENTKAEQKVNRQNALFVHALVLRGLPVQNTNDVSCFVVNYAGFPECWLNRDSIYSSRNMMWEQALADGY